jgi:hypothetical protein
MNNSKITKYQAYVHKPSMAHPPISCKAGRCIHIFLGIADNLNISADPKPCDIFNPWNLVKFEK